MNPHPALPRFIICALYTAVLAGAWDAWWHTAIGRDSFWEPPHLLLYAAVSAAILGGIVGWLQSKEKTWRRLLILLAFIPLSAPFDEFWHRMFGKEDLSNALVLWSPPHLVLIGAIAAGFAALVPLIRRDENRDAMRFFGSMALGGVLMALMFVAIPLQPIGPFHVIGFWGASANAALFATFVLVAQRSIPGLGSATLATTFFLIPLSILFDERSSPGILLPPHGHMPLWLGISSFLVPAAAADTLRRIPDAIKGALMGCIGSLIMYPFASQFLENEFRYGTQNAVTAICAAVLGGLLAGILISKFSRIFSSLGLII